MGTPCRTGRAGTVFRFAVLPVLIALPACFTYVPLDPKTVPFGEDVRLVVSNDMFRESTILATRNDQAVEGELVRATDDSVGVSVWIGRDYKGTPFESTYQTFTVARRDVVRLERRRLSKWRTGLTALAAVVGIAVLIDRVGLTANPNPPENPDPPIPPSGGMRD